MEQPTDIEVIVNPFQHASKFAGGSPFLIIKQKYDSTQLAFINMDKLKPDYPDIGLLSNIVKYPNLVRWRKNKHVPKIKPKAQKKTGLDTFFK